MNQLMRRRNQIECFIRFKADRSLKCLQYYPYIYHVVCLRRLPDGFIFVTRIIYFQSSPRTSTISYFKSYFHILNRILNHTPRNNNNFRVAFLYTHILWGLKIECKLHVS